MDEQKPTPSFLNGPPLNGRELLGVELKGVEGSGRVAEQTPELALEASLDEALAAYTAIEPSPSLAARIVAASVPPVVVPALPLRRPPRTWSVAGWLAAAATLLLWLYRSPVEIVVQPRGQNQQTVSMAQVQPAPGAMRRDEPALVPVHPFSLRYAIRHAPGNSAVGPLQPIAIEPIYLAPIQFGGGE